MNKPKQLTFPWNKVNKSSLEGFYTSQENSHIVSLLKDRSFLDDLFIYGTKESGKTFLPDLVHAEHLGSMYTIRTVLPNLESTDARPTIVRKLKKGWFKEN